MQNEQNEGMALPESTILAQEPAQGQEPNRLDRWRLGLREALREAVWLVPTNQKGLAKALILALLSANLVAVCLLILFLLLLLMK